MKTSWRVGFAFGAGFLTCLVLGVAIPLALLGSGAIDMSPRPPPVRSNRLSRRGRFDRSMDYHAPDAKNPFAQERNGRCHRGRHGSTTKGELPHMPRGAAEVDAAELAEGLNPRPPDLTWRTCRSFPTGRCSGSSGTACG